MTPQRESGESVRDASLGILFLKRASSCSFSAMILSALRRCCRSWSRRRLFASLLAFIQEATLWSALVKKSISSLLSVGTFDGVFKATLAFRNSSSKSCTLFSNSSHRHTCGTFGLVVRGISGALLFWTTLAT